MGVLDQLPEDPIPTQGTKTVEAEKSSVVYQQVAEGCMGPIGAGVAALLAWQTQMEDPEQAEQRRQAALARLLLALLRQLRAEAQGVITV